jgi:[ribosomal protein S18]-alanine N-acetyltransferase
MAVMSAIRNFFSPDAGFDTEQVVPAAETDYSIKPLTIHNLKEVLRLNLRCFRDGDNYTKHTFDYLLNEPRTLSYRVVSTAGEIVAFAFVMLNENGSAHLTTIGVAPEHRRRGLAVQLINHLESKVRARHVGTMVLEVRVGNTGAQSLYRRLGYHVVQRISKYYNNGEDCFLMMKALV